jgi:hypothetical protein
MFWSKKKAKPAKKSVPVVLDREAAKAAAMANARKARAQIGDENLQKLAALLEGQMKSEGLKAREKIRQMDSGHVADTLRDLLDDR